MTLVVEDGIGSESLKSLESASYVLNYKKKEISNQSIKGIQADYQFREGQTNFEDRSKSYARTIVFDCKQENMSMTFLILFAHPESNEIAEKITNSILVNCNQ
jgi:hypothetical protein